ncbi:hypothetical protein KEM48_011662 [Puccinia striiformis f. sp. tritici PST-130]|nr:hypothetical protein KEM48_011662 [Puccinia striiformis f. sp. tritici PST-130]
MAKAGLKALKLSNKIIRPKREEQWFLALKTVNKEDKDKVKVKVVKHIEADIVEVSDDLGLSDQEVDADDAEEGLVEPGWKWNTGDDDSGECDVTNMGFTLKKVGLNSSCLKIYRANFLKKFCTTTPYQIDYICHQIASSPQKQAKWKLWAANQKQPIRGLIGGYGIRWNIALDSRQRAWEGRRVIKQLLDNKDDRCAQGQSAGGHFFKLYEMSAKEWEGVRRLNVVLKVTQTSFNIHISVIWAS